MLTKKGVDWIKKHKKSDRPTYYYQRPLFRRGIKSHSVQWLRFQWLHTWTYINQRKRCIKCPVIY